MNVSASKVEVIDRSEAEYPERLSRVLGSRAPKRISMVGNAQILKGPKTALFCSERCPGNEILAACDWALALRQKGITVISCFHSPVERECLHILLKGTQLIIHCPARALDNMRIPKELKPALEDGRLLILSPFVTKPRRPTAVSARERNDMISALADACIIPYAEPGGEVERIKEQMKKWHVPIKSVIER